MEGKKKNIINNKGPFLWQSKGESAESPRATKPKQLYPKPLSFTLFAWAIFPFYVHEINSKV